MPLRKPTPDGDPDGGTTFEAAIAELEAIVAAMEEEQLPLEELVARYEKGSKLLACCETVLASAKKRLQTISDRTAAEAASLADDAEDEMPDEPDEHDDDDDIRLF